MQRIPKSWSISAPELKEQLAAAGFDRSLRTIERQLLNISDQFDVERDTRSKPYGYKWKSHAKGLNLPTMSADETVLLTMAEKHLNNILPEKLTKSLRTYFKQARSMLLEHPNSAGSNSKDWLKKVDIVSPTQPLIAPDVNGNIMATVSNALFENKWLMLTYKNAGGYVQDYRVMPLALVQQDVRLYLVCRFEGYDNERNLAIHRINKAHAQTLTFKPPKSFDLQKYIAQGRFGVSEGEKIMLSFSVLKNSGKHLLETPLSKDQVAKKKGEYLEVSATIVNSDMLDRWLNSFGDAIKGVKKQPL